MNSMQPITDPDYTTDHLLAAVEHDDVLARMVAGQFLALGENLPERLAVALAARDTSAASRLAHEIKGMAAMLGAQRLASAAHAIEREVLPASPPTVLLEEWRRVSRRLTDYIRSSDTTS
jgi:HPt (histidine-containing phosphotransfer) domain-containing protein